MLTAHENFSSVVNISLSSDVQSIATAFTIITITLASITILVGFMIVFRLIYSGKLTKRYSKSSSRRLGLLHSINTYIHIIGETTVFLLMSSRTLYGDLYIHPKEELSPSWHCRLLNCLMSMFASGIYGSCFLQSLFRFWRVMKHHHRLYRKFSFHCQLILLHWILIIVLSIPVWFRSVYLSSENFCLNRFTDTYSSIYISITSVGIPVTLIVIVYFKLLLRIKHHWQSRKRWRRMKRDLSVIKRIILLVFVLLNVSTAGIILWLLMFIQQYLHPLSYRILCFIIGISMPICIITLLIVSPQLRRALRSSNHDRQEQHSKEKKLDIEEPLRVDSESCF